MKDTVQINFRVVQVNLVSTTGTVVQYKLLATDRGVPRFLILYENELFEAEFPEDSHPMLDPQAPYQLYSVTTDPLGAIVHYAEIPKPPK
jgi:hypothetical protein